MNKLSNTRQAFRQDKLVVTDKKKSAVNKSVINGLVVWWGIYLIVENLMNFIQMLTYNNANMKLICNNNSLTAI